MSRVPSMLADHFRLQETPELLEELTVWAGTCDVFADLALHDHRENVTQITEESARSA